MAIESAIALMVLVVGFGGLMEIVQASYTDDRMGRAARAAARALALDPSANDPSAYACAAIRREFHLADDFDCGAWTLNVYRGVSPSALPVTLDAAVTTGTGDMVLVRIGWSRDVWSFDASMHDVNADDTVQMVATGLARCEAELCGRGTP